MNTAATRRFVLSVPVPAGSLVILAVLLGALGFPVVSGVIGVVAITSAVCGMGYALHRQDD